MNKKKKAIIAIIIIFVIIIGFVAVINSDPSLKFTVRKFNFFIYDQCCRFVVPEILQDFERVPVESSFLSNFETSELITGIFTPTQMTFIGNDILFLEKNNGQVRLIRDGILVKEPLLDFNVFGFHEAGLIGILSVDSTVYLYLTESTEDGKPAIGNHIYRYEWTGEDLINGKLVTFFLHVMQYVIMEVLWH